MISLPASMRSVSPRSDLMSNHRLQIVLVFSRAAPKQIACRPIHHECRVSPNHSAPIAPLPERNLPLNTQELTEEISHIETAMTRLDDRRSALVHRLTEASTQSDSPHKILHFPGRVLVRRSPRGAAADWPRGSKVAPTDKA